jgi:hypothetical protein
MRSIVEIREMLSTGRYNLSRHALRRMIERNISDELIRQAGGRAELIEDDSSHIEWERGFTKRRRQL